MSGVDTALVNVVVARLAESAELLNRFLEQPAEVTRQIAGKDVDDATLEAIRRGLVDSPAIGELLTDDDLSKVAGGFLRTRLASLKPAVGRGIVPAYHITSTGL